MDKEKTNVAIFTSAQGGLAHYSTHLFTPLKKWVNPFYVTYSDALIDELVEEHVGKVYPLLRNQDASSILLTLRFLEQKDIKVINFNIATTARKMFLYYTALLARARLMGIKVVGTIHDVMPFETFYIDPAALDLLYSSMDHYIVGNESEYNKLQLYFDIPSNKIDIVGHGPYTLFDNEKYSKESAREKLKIPQDKKVILFFGLLRPHKGLKYLLKAFAKIAKSQPDAFLYIVSDTAYSPEMNELLKRIDKSEVKDSIKVDKQYIPSSQIEVVFKAADILALPYTTVSQSGVLNLAYAFKKPVVVTDAFPDASIIDRKFGRVVKSANANELEAALTEMIAIPDNKLQKYGQAGYDYSIDHYSWDKAAKQVNSIITRLLNN